MTHPAHGNGGHRLAAPTAQLLADTAGALDPIDTAAAGRVRDEAARLRHVAAGVVVVGEKKRGKSSLINALVDEPDLLPVDADVATCVHLAVSHGPQRQARVVDLAAPQGRPIPPEDIAAYAALDPATQQHRHPDVSHVEVSLPRPLLDGLVLVDTPGIGSLLAGHAEVTLAALDRADAALVVVHAGMELAASEVAFLARVTDRVRAVLFVLTQIDKYPAWERIRDRDRELLAAHAPQLADAAWFPVSGHLHQLAASLQAEGAHEDAARLRATAGIEQLRQALRDRVAGRAAHLRLSAAVDAALTELREVITAQELAQHALRHDPELAVALRRERDRLKTVTEQGAQWRRKLRQRFKELETELNLEFNRGLNDLSATASAAIVAGGQNLLDELPEQLIAGAQALWATVDTRLRDAVAAIAADAASHLSADATTSEAIAVPQRIENLPRPDRAEAAAIGLAGVVEYAMGSAGVGALAATLLTGIVAPVTTVVAGLGAAYFLQHRRKLRDRMVRERAAANRHLNLFITEMKTEFPPALKTALRVVSDRMELAGEQTLTGRRRELEEALAALERAARAETARLDADRAAIQARLDALGELAQRAADLDDELAKDEEDHRDGV
ncbi:dynamin family protein [Catellatospora citrea]|uniref:Dynamin n=1 Tax=Catellatospora citrea TaxID=53366 RepID=A0A8J3KCP9_9ACTN|nr:dynamin family protein [Catellatospora citrea]RKE11173.1 uncharacterized protein YicC (UPF0701 family) [Catellatospora citrea]GIF96638.1 dynamin [Catellatospora citrea]